jgi:hypothetical protein
LQLSRNPIFCRRHRRQDWPITADATAPQERGPYQRPPVSATATAGLVSLRTIAPAGLASGQHTNGPPGSRAGAGIYKNCHAPIQNMSCWPRWAWLGLGATAQFLRTLGHGSPAPQRGPPGERGQPWPILRAGPPGAGHENAPRYPEPRAGAQADNEGRAHGGESL